MGKFLDIINNINEKLGNKLQLVSQQRFPKHYASGALKLLNDSSLSTITCSLIYPGPFANMFVDMEPCRACRTCRTRAP